MARRQHTWKCYTYVGAFICFVPFIYHLTKTHYSYTLLSNNPPLPSQLNYVFKDKNTDVYIIRKQEFSFGRSIWTDHHLPDWFNDFKRDCAIFGNEGGMKLPHQFAVYTVLKILKPQYIIESGVWKGATTRLINSVLPDSHIISIDTTCFKTVFTKQTVICGSNFTDFKDLGKLFQAIEKNSTLVIFDDHQSGFLRVLQAVKFGFKYVIVDDNYPFGSGDNYSPKQVLTDTDSNKVLFLDNFGRKKKTITKMEHVNNRNTFKRVVKTYTEFPPLNKNMTVKWFASTSGRETEKHFSEITISGVGITVPFTKDYLEYRFICFMELNPDLDLL